MFVLSLLILVACGSDGGLNATVRGVSCWDLDNDGEGSAGEDVNADGAWDALDCRGVDGAGGAAGQPGPQGDPGQDGAPGRDGVNCWDIDGDGVSDPEEDANTDGTWSAADCRGASAGAALQKGALYEVTGTTAGTSSAACDDADDIMVTGGCRFQESCIPAHFTSYPRYNDDDSRPAEWYCSLNCGSVTASGFCLDVTAP